MRVKTVKIVRIVIVSVVVAAFALITIRNSLVWFSWAREQRLQIAALEQQLTRLQAKHAGWLKDKEQLVKQAEEIQSLREENEKLRQVLARLQTDKPAP